MPRRDIALVRRFIAALADPTRQRALRALLRAHLASERRIGLKALLAAAPLDGVKLERRRDLGRTIEL